MLSFSILMIIFSVLLILRFNVLGLSSDGAPDDSQELESCTIDISPDSSKLIFSAIGELGKKSLFLLNLRTFTAHRLTKSISDDSFPSFSPDGKNVVFERSLNLETSGRLWVLNLRSGLAKPVSKYESGGLMVPRFSEDGTRILAYSRTPSTTDTHGSNYPACIFEIWPNRSSFRWISGADYSDWCAPQLSRMGGQLYFQARETIYSVKDSANARPVPIEASGVECWSPRLLTSGRRILYFSDCGLPTQGVSRLFVKDLQEHAHSVIVGGVIDGEMSRNIVTTTGARIYFLVGRKPSIMVCSLTSKKIFEFADSTLFQDPTHWRPVLASAELQEY